MLLFLAILLSAFCSAPVHRHRVNWLVSISCYRLSEFGAEAVSAKFPRSIWFVLEGLDTERNLQDLTFVLKHMLKRKIVLHGKVKSVPIMLSKVPSKPVIAS